MKILLTSSSRHGSTDEVAAVIAERLQAAQIDVETRRPEDVDSVDGYDAFILGSAVYMTKWTPEAVDFTKRFHDALKARPVWAFSVGLSGLPQGKVADPMRIGPVLLAIDPEDHMTFAGRFDPSRLSLGRGASVGRCHCHISLRRHAHRAPGARLTAAEEKGNGRRRKITATTGDCISMQ